MEHADRARVHRLASMLVEQLALALPPDVDLSLEYEPWPRVRLTAECPGNATFDFGLLAHGPSGPLQPARVEGAILTFLGFVQDFLVMHTKTPWPGTERDLPLPRVAMDGENIEAWFGDEPDTPRAMRISLKPMLRSEDDESDSR